MADPQSRLEQVIFFCYPTICIVSFAAFICRFLTLEDSILQADDTVVCQDPSHRVLQGVSLVVIASVSIGLPVVFGIILVRLARSYDWQSNKELAASFGKEMDVHADTAGYVIRDITIGRQYSFLMDAYNPRYLYLLRAFVCWRALKPHQNLHC